MTDDLHFTAEEFARLSPEEKIVRCTQLAERAQATAVNAPIAQKSIYLDIANNWLSLAHAISAQRENTQKSGKRAESPAS